MSEPTQTNRKKSRRRNGDGNTYRHKNGWRTVISHKGHTVTAFSDQASNEKLPDAKIKNPMLGQVLVKLFESLSIVAKPTSSNPAVITAIHAIDLSPSSA